MFRKKNVGSRESLDMAYSRDNLGSPASSNSNLAENRARLAGRNRKSGFTAFYIGPMTKITMQASNRMTSEAQLIEKVEQSQLEGRLPLKPTLKDQVRLRLDKHGLQVAKDDSEDIILRVPLHTLAQLVHYADGFGKYNLAVKVIMGKDLYSCHIFQCPTEDTAMSICETLQRVFRTIMAENQDASI